MTDLILTMLGSFLAGAIATILIWVWLDAWLSSFNPLDILKGAIPPEEELRIRIPESKLGEDLMSKDVPPGWIEGPIFPDDEIEIELSDNPDPGPFWNPWKPTR